MDSSISKKKNDNMYSSMWGHNGQVNACAIATAHARNIHTSEQKENCTVGLAVIQRHGNSTNELRCANSPRLIMFL